MDKPVQEWTKEEKDNVVDGFLKEVSEAIDSRLLTDGDTRKLLVTGHTITIVVDQEGCNTYYSEKK